MPVRGLEVVTDLWVEEMINVTNLQISFLNSTLRTTSYNLEEHYLADKCFTEGSAHEESKEDRITLYLVAVRQDMTWPVIEVYCLIREQPGNPAREKGRGLLLVISLTVKHLYGMSCKLTAEGITLDFFYLFLQIPLQETSCGSILDYDPLHVEESLIV